MLVATLAAVWWLVPDRLSATRAQEPVTNRESQEAGNATAPTNIDSGRTRLAGGAIRPALDQDDLFFLLRYARRAMADTLRGRQTTTQPYCPSALRDFDAEIHLTAWRKGAELAKGHHKSVALQKSKINLRT